MKDHIFPDNPDHVRSRAAVAEASRDDIPEDDARALGSAAMTATDGVIDLTLTADEAVRSLERDLAESEEVHSYLDLITEEAETAELKTLTDRHGLQLIEELPDDEQEAMKVMEAKGFAKVPPRFQEQLHDKGRLEKFTPYKDKQPKTEHEGLVNLNAFLGAFIESCQQAEIPAGSHIDELVTQAKSMLENLTFIGFPEYMEAVIGIGNLWKSYLAEDPDRQIAVLTKVGGLSRYLRKGNMKSDEYLFTQILESFSQEELELFGPRIVTEIEDLSVEPEKARIVLLDDWTISGNQMRDVYKMVRNDPEAAPYIEEGCVEINLLAAGGERIDNGLDVNPYNPDDGSLPVRAYYRAHDAPAATNSGNAHITGLHSAVNYGFYNVCEEIQGVIQKEFGVHMVPLLAKIFPEYRGKVMGDRIMMTSLRQHITQIVKPSRRSRDER